MISQKNTNFNSDLFPTNISKLVNELFNEATPLSSHRPHLDVMEFEDSYKLNLAIPGVQKEDVKIEINEGVLSVSGEFKSGDLKPVKYHLQEIRKTSFERKIKLPKNADFKKIEARFEAGILHLDIAKKLEAKPQIIKIK